MALGDGSCVREIGSPLIEHRVLSQLEALDAPAKADRLEWFTKIRREDQIIADQRQGVGRSLRECGK